MRRIFPHYLINSENFGGKNIEHKMSVLIFSTTCLKHVHSKKNLTRYYHKCTQVFMLSTCYSCHILKQLEFSRQIFGEKLPHQIS